MITEFLPLVHVLHVLIPKMNDDLYKFLNYFLLKVTDMTFRFQIIKVSQRLRSMNLGPVISVNTGSGNFMAAQPVDQVNKKIIRLNKCIQQI